MCRYVSLPAFVFYIILVCGLFVSCRSGDSTLHSVKSEAGRQINDSISRRTDGGIIADSVRLLRVSQNWSVDHLRITFFDDSGRIQQIQEQWRSTGHDELADSTRRTSVSFLSEQTDSTHSSSATQTDTEIDEHSKTDSRTVQGIEWGYIMLAIGISVILYFIIKKWL